jgi:hypothetical protein
MIDFLISEEETTANKNFEINIPISIRPDAHPNGCKGWMREQHDGNSKWIAAGSGKSGLDPLVLHFDGLSLK